jgi:hypothetical protein
MACQAQSAVADRDSVTQKVDYGKAVAFKTTPYMPYAPHVRQHAFLWLDCLEALFGGAAGGGKSDALLMAALQYVDTPGYAAILFRKTMTDLKLPGSLIPRSHDWLAGTDASWNGSENTWTFPSKATLTFGYMRNDDERHRYRSTEFQYIGWDELTDFTRLQYTYMFSRLRRLSSAEDVPLRVRAATNPGGRGHEWVKRRFITRVDEPPDDQRERVFIKSLLTDNPSLDQKMYMYSLEQLDVQTRAHLLEGDWDAREPGNWMIRNHTWIDAAVEKGREWAQSGPPEPAGGELSLGLDWGTHTAGYVIWPLTKGGVYIPPSEVVSEVDDDTIDTSRRLIRSVMRFPYRLADARYDAAGAQEMKVFTRTIRAETPFKLVKPVPIAFSKWKRMGIIYLNILFQRVAAGAQSRIIVIDPANEELIRQLKIWERKNAESEEAIKEDDHGPDALVAGVVPIAEKHSDMVNEMREAAKRHTTKEAEK